MMTITRMLRQKILNRMASHPRLATLGIGLAITLAVGAVLGMVDGHSHTALATIHLHPPHCEGAHVGDNC